LLTYVCISVLLGNSNKIIKNNKKMKQQKGISTLVGIIIIVVVVIIIFGGVFVYQNFATKKNNIQTAVSPVQSQQATESWKTYTSDKYGFSFAYISSWFCQKPVGEGNSFELTIACAPSEKVLSEGPSFPIEVRIMDKNNSLYSNLINWPDNAKTKDGVENLKKQTLKIGDYQAVKRTWNIGGTSQESIQFTNGDLIFQFYSNLLKEHPEYSGTLENMAETFKLIK